MRATRTALCVAALLGAGLFPAPAADGPAKEQAAASQNNLKEIGIAFHAYADEHKLKWADDITDKDGKVLLSWRVALLPYLEQQALYKQFKLDEPWDGPNNKKLIAKIPKVYAPVRGKAKPGETYYQRFVGKDALFNERGSDFTIPGVPDGTSNTALVVEAGAPVIWTKPADLTFNRRAPLPELGGLFGGDFHALFCDGSVYRIRKDYDADEMKKVVMPADGMTVDLRKLQK
jgi:hypothetical protein